MFKLEPWGHQALRAVEGVPVRGDLDCDTWTRKVQEWACQEAEACGCTAEVSWHGTASVSFFLKGAPVVAVIHPPESDEDEEWMEKLAWLTFRVG